VATPVAAYDGRCLRIALASAPFPTDARPFRGHLVSVAGVPGHPTMTNVGRNTTGVREMGMMVAGQETRWGGTQ